VAVYLPCPPAHPLKPAFEAHLTALVSDLEARLASSASATDDSNTQLEARRQSTQRVGPSAAFEGVSGGASARDEATGAGRRARLTVSVLHAEAGLAREGAAVLGPDVARAAAVLADAAGSARDAAAQPTSSDTAPQLELYPINGLRNAALRAATASHVWLVDGDFIPSRGLARALTQPSGERGSLLDASDAEPWPVMWVVAAWELASFGRGAQGSGPLEVADGVRAVVPRTLEELVALLTTCHDVPNLSPAATAPASGLLSAGGERPQAVLGGRGPAGEGRKGVQLRAFHCGRYPQRRLSLDYAAWAAAAAKWVGAEAEQPAVGERRVSGGGGWHELSYNEFFEPYGIVRRDQVRADAGRRGQAPSNVGGCLAAQPPTRSLASAGMGLRGCEGWPPFVQRGEKSCERQEETRAVGAAQWSGCRACKACSKTTSLTHDPDTPWRGAGYPGAPREGQES
jgi:hypothetical protein